MTSWPTNPISPAVASNGASETFGQDISRRADSLSGLPCSRAGNRRVISVTPDRGASRIRAATLSRTAAQPFPSVLAVNVLERAGERIPGVCADHQRRVGPGNALSGPAPFSITIARMMGVSSGAGLNAEQQPLQAGPRAFVKTSHGARQSGSRIVSVSTTSLPLSRKAGGHFFAGWRSRRTDNTSTPPTSGWRTVSGSGAIPLPAPAFL